MTIKVLIHTIDSGQGGDGGEKNQKASTTQGWSEANETTETDTREQSELPCEEVLRRSSTGLEEGASEAS